MPRATEPIERLEEHLDEFAEGFMAEYRRVTWRNTWACAAIVAVLNTALVVAVEISR